LEYRTRSKRLCGRKYGKWKNAVDIISEPASIVCKQIEAAVAFADSEEDLRVGVEKAIEFSAESQAFLKSKAITKSRQERAEAMSV